MTRTAYTAPLSAASRLTAAALVAGIALGVSTQTASAKSFLEGQSSGMRRCVSAILTGDKQVKHVKVHGHHFNCKPMFRGTNERGIFRQIRVSHDQFGKDDSYFTDFRVNAQNVLLRNTLKTHVVKGASFQTLKNKARFLHSMTLYWSLLIEGVDSLSVPPFRGSLTYDIIAELARAIPVRKVKNWETAATQILYIAIAEHGRSFRVRVPAPGQSSPAPSQNGPAPAQSGTAPRHVKQNAGGVKWPGV